MAASPQRFRVLGVLLVLLVLALLGRMAEAAGAEGRPNILLCLADDWSWPHASVYGDPVVKTPNIDRLAADGVLWTHAFAAAPSCTPSRASILTGQWVHRLGPGADQSGILPGEHRVYPDALEEAGYVVGFSGKGWAPGTLKGTGRTRNPAGPKFNRFADFLAQVPPGKPFYFWFGSLDPHRPYTPGSGKALGIAPKDVVVPPHLPDTPTVRQDLLDYYFEVQRFDREVGELLNLLREKDLLKSTLVVVTGDQGMPFPRCKTNVYDSGMHVPLVISWPDRASGGRRIDDFVSLTDLAPTFLEAAGVKPWPEITGRSLLPILGSDKQGHVDPARDKVFLERERHGFGREGGQSYPVRAVRTSDYLYVRNLRPHLLPAGDPAYVTVVGPYADMDPGPTKIELLDGRDRPELAPFFARACLPRPAEELYDLAKDPGQLCNVTGQSSYAEVQQRLRREVERWMSSSGDPRAGGETDVFDKAPFVGAPPTFEGKKLNPQRKKRAKK